MRLIYNELKNLLILIAFINLLVSCSSTRIVYSLAEEFFFNEINYYLNVDKNDKTFLDKQISEMIDWHRTSMLPMYSIYLTDMADRIFTGQYSTNDVKKFESNLWAKKIKLASKINTTILNINIIVVKSKQKQFTIYNIYKYNQHV